MKTVRCQLLALVAAGFLLSGCGVLIPLALVAVEAAAPAVIRATVIEVAAATSPAPVKVAQHDDGPPLIEPDDVGP